MTPLTRDAFDRLVADQCRMVGAVNALEYQLYQLGESPDDRVAACRETAADLIAQLRDLLFQWDQSVMPRIEPDAGAGAPGAGS